MKLNLIKRTSLVIKGVLPEARKALARSIVSIALALVTAPVGIKAQQSGNNQVPSQPGSTAPRPDVQQAYRAAPRDPFKREVKRPEAAKGNRMQMKLPPQEPRPVAFPSLNVRREEFKRMVDMALERDMPEPSPISQYLVGELEVTGVFRDDRGFGAFLRAQPTGTMFFVRSGVRVYNGEVLRIDGSAANMAASQVQFREVTYWELDGKRSPQEKVVAKTAITTSKK